MPTILFYMCQGNVLKCYKGYPYHIHMLPLKPIVYVRESSCETILMFAQLQVFTYKELHSFAEPQCLSMT